MKHKHSVVIIGLIFNITLFSSRCRSVKARGATLDVDQQKQIQVINEKLALSA
jgi:hypothetical protein